MTINDEMFAALERFDGSLNEKLLAFYQLNGGSGHSQINDAERAFLEAAGATPGSLNDMWYEYLRDNGYTGTVNDMLHQWVLDGGMEPAPPIS